MQRYICLGDCMTSWRHKSIHTLVCVVLRLREVENAQKMNEIDSLN